MIEGFNHSTLNNLTYNQDEFFVLGGVACRYHFYDSTSPLVFCFATAGSVVRGKNIKHGKEVYPWGFDFVKKQKINVIAFASIDRPCWYLSPTFHSGLKHLMAILPKTLSMRVGYGSSMGGMIGAFSQIFELDRLLLINPITTVSQDKVPWESRFGPAKKLDWNVKLNDGATATCGGYVVYDNLFHLDKLHVERLPSNFKRLIVSGVGHCMPEHLLHLGLLKSLFNDFVHDSVCSKTFREKARKRRNYYRYYDWLLSSENVHLTKKRANVINHYRLKLGPFEDTLSKRLAKDDIDKMRDLAVALEGIDIRLATHLMSLAHKARPEGTYIAKKLSEYNAIINTNHE